MCTCMQHLLHSGARSVDVCMANVHGRTCCGGLPRSSTVFCAAASIRNDLQYSVLPTLSVTLRDSCTVGVHLWVNNLSDVMWFTKVAPCQLKRSSTDYFETLSWMCGLG